MVLISLQSFKANTLPIQISNKLTYFSLLFSICREYIAYEFSQRFMKLSWINVELAIEKNIPKQTNHFDCGIFVCEYTENISCKANFNFNQNDTHFIRECIKTEIILETSIPDPLNI